MFQALNCNIQFNHPVDHAWGTVLPGHISGLYKFLVDGNTDLVASCQYIHENFLNVRRQKERLYFFEWPGEMFFRQKF